MKWKNFNIGTKLSVGFGAVIVVMLIVAIRMYAVLDNLEANKIDIINSTEVADNIMESKFAVRSDQLLLMEALEETDKDVVKTLIVDHNVGKAEIEKNLTSAANLYQDESWGAKYSDTKALHFKEITETLSIYLKEVSPYIDDALDLKTSSAGDAMSDSLLLAELTSIDLKADAAASQVIPRQNSCSSYSALLP